MSALTGDSAPVSAKYFPVFDYLRFALALGVLLTHAGFSPWQRSGDYCVQVFFALSGWLIGRILAKSSIEDLPRFYFNRATRIWIPYFLTIGLLMAASLIKREPITSKWIEIFFYDITFVYNLFGPQQLAEHVHLMPLDGTGNHFWSICAEEQFYLLAPILIVTTPCGIGRSILFWAAISLCALWSPYSDYFASISLGVLAAVSTQKINWTQSVRVRAPALFIAIIGIAILVKHESAYSLFAPFFATVTVIASSISGSNSRLGEILGGISYPLYLNQWIGGFAGNAIFGHGTEMAQVSGVILSVLVATALYFSVDRIVRQYRGRFYTEALGLGIALAAGSLVTIGLLGSALF